LIAKKAAGALLYCAIIGTGVGTFAGWGLDSLQADYSTTEQPSFSLASVDAQASNSVAKSDRLAPVRVASLAPAASSALLFDDRYMMPASLPPAALPPAAAIPAPALAAEPPSRSAARAAPPAPERHSKAAPPAPPAPPNNAILDDSQIASIKNRLRLTPEQAEYWPSVEAALRDVARQQARLHKQRSKGAPPPIDPESAEVKKLMWAAMPLLRQLREDQKREVRMLVRVLGLHKVAAYI